jgi:hypothetical protein
MYSYRRPEWIAHLEECKKVRRTNENPATPKQFELLVKLFVPIWVVEELTVGEASDIIDTRLKEQAEWHKQQAEKKALEAKLRADNLAIERKRIEEEKQIKAAMEKSIAKPKPSIITDPVTGMTGHPNQIQWASNIKTSLTPYLTKMKQSCTNKPDIKEVIDYAIIITDAAFWIAFRRADMDDDTFKRMIEDSRRRKKLDLVSQPEKDGLMDWDSIEKYSKKK